MNRLIVIEGLDGSGKSTQTEILKKRLKDAGTTAKHIKLPDYDAQSSALVKMYLGGDFGKNPADVNAYAASSFYAVDRYANYVCKWKKDYDDGIPIVADRYTTSNAAHQMTKLDRHDWDAYLSWLEDFEYGKLEIPKPVLVLYLDMPVEISQKLMTSRYDGDENKKDVHEANVNYLKKCRETALYAAQKLDWTVINCSIDGNPRAIDDIADEIFDIVNRKVFGGVLND